MGRCSERRRRRPKEGKSGRVKPAAAYLRVSTTQQDWKLQRLAVARAAAARGDRIPKRLWFEEKKSGGTIDRPVLHKLRAAVRAGQVGHLYVFRIDRLTRSGIRDTLGLVEEFRRHGAELVSVADGFDLSGPGAEIVLAVMAWAAQMERNAIGERIKAARVRVEAAGGRWGRPRSVDPTTLEKARVLQRKGKSLRAIAVSLKVPRSTLADALGGKGHYAAVTSKTALPSRRMRAPSKVPTGSPRESQRTSPARRKGKSVVRASGSKLQTSRGAADKRSA